MFFKFTIAIYKWVSEQDTMRDIYDYSIEIDRNSQLKEGRTVYEVFRCFFHS